MNYSEFVSIKLPPICEQIYNNHEVRVTASGNLKIDGENVTQKNIAEHILRFHSERESLGFSQILTLTTNLASVYTDFKKQMMVLKSTFRKKSNNDHVVVFDYENLYPFISIEDHSKIVFYNANTKEIANIDYKTYELVVDKEFRRPLSPVKIEFYPYRPEHKYIKEIHGVECTHINLYKRPKWQLEVELTSTQREKFCKLPQIIDDFMCHLFPSKVCREYVYDWLHFAIAKRNETYLVLNGAKGAGKNLFSENLCKALIGEENHKMAPPSALESGFNALLVDSRFIVLDEFKIDDDDKLNRLKRYINKDQMIEFKGVDVKQTIETFNSFVISNNALTDMRIYWDDRRFSVADISKQKLKDVWSQDKIDELVDALTPDSEEIRNFGYWLLYRNLTNMRNEFDWFAGDHFYKLCYTTMPEWAKVIIDLATSGKKSEITDADVREEYRKRAGHNKIPSVQKIEDFLSNYKHNGSSYLGTLNKNETFWYITVSEEFIKSSEDSTGIDWDSVL